MMYVRDTVDWDPRPGNPTWHIVSSSSRAVSAIHSLQFIFIICIILVG